MVAVILQFKDFLLFINSTRSNLDLNRNMRTKFHLPTLIKSLYDLLKALKSSENEKYMTVKNSHTRKHTIYPFRIKKCFYNLH